MEIYSAHLEIERLSIAVCVTIVCSRPEDGLRCRQGIKPPLKTDSSYKERHRRMRRGAGGAAAPPSFWATQFFGQRRSFFWAAAMVGGGCFSIFRRADDVTQTMPKGGGACEIPPFRKSCIRACYLCKILGNQPLRPP